MYRGGDSFGALEGRMKRRLSSWGCGRMVNNWEPLEEEPWGLDDPYKTLLSSFSMRTTVKVMIGLY